MTNSQYRDAESFLRNAQPSTIVDDLFSSLEDDALILNSDRLRRGQDWSALAGQVVGGEYNI
jgi:hypothetical protein